MKTILTITLLILWHSVSAQPDTWTKVDSVNGPGKSVATSFVALDQAFLVGGLTASDFTRKMYSFDPIPNDWDDELSWGGETGSGQNRGNAVSFAINDKGYVGLGQGNSALYYKDFWCYDPVAQTWTQLADFEGSARHGAVAFANSNYGFVGTGQSVDGLEKDFWRFDPTNNSWLQLNDFPGTARKFAVACMMGAEAYIGTGDDGVLKNDLWQYQPGTDTWTQKTNMPTVGRVGAVAWGTYPTMYIATGENMAGDFLNDVWEYNRWTNSWTPRASLPAIGRTHATAFVIRDVGYIATGYNNGLYYDDCWAYTKILGLEEEQKEQVVIYPNPTTEIIQWNDSGFWKNVNLVTLEGKIIGSTLSSEEKINVRDLPNGNYYLNFTNNDGKEEFTSFVKQ